MQLPRIEGLEIAGSPHKYEHDQRADGRYAENRVLDETEEEIQDTIEMACSLPLTRAAFNVVIPIPGTQIFDELIDKDKLKIEDINWDTLTNDQVAFQRDHISGKRLMALQREAFLRFYSRPSRIIRVGQETLRNRKVLWAALNKLASWVLWPPKNPLKLNCGK